MIKLVYKKQTPTKRHGISAPSLKASSEQCYFANKTHMEPTLVLELLPNMSEVCSFQVFHTLITLENEQPQKMVICREM
jgi:hypothetical protein